MIVYYDESILSYVASIRKYYGLDSSYKSNEKFDEMIKEYNPNKIFLFLIDGMGANLIERKLSEDSFLRRNMKFKVQTVFPPTTTAATTSIRNGKAPNENGWLGWMQYMKEFDDVIVPFLGTGYYNDNYYGGRAIMEKLVPITDTETELNNLGIKARKLFPEFEQDGCKNLDEMCSRLVDYSNNSDYKYIYAYWDKYDTYMHKHGVDDPICDSYLNYINYELENLSNKLSEDTLLVIVADHGQITIDKLYNIYGSKYDKYLRIKPAIEGRAAAFYIKDGMQDEFEKKFKDEFEDSFVLLSQKQVLDTHLFGDNKNCERFVEFIGDYIAIAKKKVCFEYCEDGDIPLIGNHAGMCDDEIMIPIIVYKK